MNNVEIIKESSLSVNDYDIMHICIIRSWQYLRMKQIRT